MHLCVLERSTAQHSTTVLFVRYSQFAFYNSFPFDNPHCVYHGLWFFAHLFVHTTARRYNYQFTKLPSTIKMNTLYFAQHSIPQAIDYERMTIRVILIRITTIVSARNGEKKRRTKDRWRKNTQTGMSFNIRVLVKSWKKSVLK